MFSGTLRVFSLPSHHEQALLFICALKSLIQTLERLARTCETMLKLWFVHVIPFLCQASMNLKVLLPPQSPVIVALSVKCAVLCVWKLIFDWPLSSGEIYRTCGKQKSFVRGEPAFGSKYGDWQITKGDGPGDSQIAEHEQINMPEMKTHTKIVFEILIVIFVNVLWIYIYIYLHYVHYWPFLSPCKALSLYIHVA